jgi:PAS domain S-box-containing protein
MNNLVELPELQRKLEVVVSTGLLLAQKLDLQAIVQSTTDAGLLLSGAQFGAFFYNVINAEGESYLLYTLAGVDRAKFDKFPMPRNTQVFAPTFEGTGVVRSADITKDPRYGHNAPHHGMPAGHLPVRSYLAVPVKTQSGEVLGGLFYGHEKTDVFQEEAETLVTTIAAYAATAIENFRLREQLTNKIAEFQHSEIRLKDATKHLGELAAIVESSDDAIISKDLTGRINSWNPAAERILGYTSDEIVGSSILRIIPPELHPEEVTILQKIRNGQRIDHYETIRLTKGGERLNVSLSVSPLRDETGKVIGASKILRDISGKKRMEASLIQAEKVAAAGRMAATIAHEINNPLEAVVNLLYLAKMRATDTEQISFLDSAESELNRVSHIARQTLGFYREHSAPKSISPAELVSEAVRIYKPRCKVAGITVTTNLNSERRIMLRQGEIMQVVSNLISNAIYAMPQGGTLCLAVEDGPNDGVVLVVGDTGVGIPPENLARVYEAFFTTRSSIGTGIGLFITKQFVEGHGGTIAIESSTSADSHGTKVSIFLPSRNSYSTSTSSGLTNS